MGEEGGGGVVKCWGGGLKWRASVEMNGGVLWGGVLGDEVHVGME